MPPMILLKVLRLADIFSLKEKRPLVIAWMEREGDEGRPLSQKMIADACRMANSTLYDSIQGSGSWHEG